MVACHIGSFLGVRRGWGADRVVLLVHGHLNYAAGVEVARVYTHCRQTVGNDTQWNPGYNQKIHMYLLRGNPVQGSNLLLVQWSMTTKAVSGLAELSLPLCFMYGARSMQT